MPMVRTVLRDIEASELGVTNAHEHLAMCSGLVLLQHPDYRLDSLDRAVEEVTDFLQAGGQAILEATPCGLGRNPEMLRAIAQQTGVHIIAATGVHKASYYLDSHWRFRSTPEEMASLWEEEIQLGMELSGYEGPRVHRSGVKAGIVKVGSGYHSISEAEKKAFHAAARVHHKTGAPIMTHCETGTMMLEQVALLESERVNPQHIILSHADRNPDWLLHRDVAETGAFLEYDGPGRVKYSPDSTIVELLRKLFDLGLGGHLLLGGDNAHRSYWKSYGGGPGISYVQRIFIPRLRREGFSGAQLRQLLVTNAAAALSFREDCAGACHRGSALEGGQS